MKTKQILFLLLFLAVLSTSCKKRLFDSRNKYIGEWEFVVEKTTFNLGNPSSNSHSKKNTYGEISYGGNEDKLLISYTENDKIVLSIDENGKLYNFPSHYAGGTISENTIKIHLRWGGLGGGITHAISGNKK